MFDAEGRNEGRSFISGHAGFMLAAYVYFGLWFAGKLRALSSRYRERTLWKTSVLYCLVCVSFLVGISRILDGNHHWWNVAMGFAVGLFAGSQAYFQYWPSPWSNLSWSPLAMMEREGDFTAHTATWERGLLLKMLQSNNFSIPDDLVESRAKDFPLPLASPSNIPTQEEVQKGCRIRRVSSACAA
jgi:hypothetical protein